MAHPTYIPGYKFKLSTYAATDSPGVKAFICGLDQYAINFNAPPITAPSRDCADPTARVLMQAAPGVETITINGSGRYVVAHYASLMTAFRLRTHTNIVIERMEDVAGVETAQESWTGAFVFSDLNLDIPADGSSFANISITAQSHGLITFTPDV